MRGLAVAGLAALGLALAALLLPIEIPVSMKVPVRILPAREWLVTGAARSGRFAVVLRDNATGLVEDLATHLSGSDDDLRVELRAGLAAGMAVAEGDTLGRLRSAALEARLAQVQARLATAQAQLRLQAADRREALIASTRREVAASEQQTRQQRLRLEQLQARRETGQATKAQVEEAQNLLALAAIGEELARGELAAAMAGYTPREGGPNLDQVQAWQQEHDQLQQRRAARALVAPFRGRLAAKAAGDTVLAVQEADAWVAQLYVPARDQGRLARGAAVSVLVPGRDSALLGQVERIADRRYAYARQPIVLAWARLRPADGLSSGQAGRATIRVPGMRLRQYLAGLASR